MKEREEKTFNAFDTKASVLKRIKYGVIVLLVLVLLFFLVGYREDITVENIRYLLKYVNVSPAKIGSTISVRNAAFVSTTAPSGRFGT